MDKLNNSIKGLESGEDIIVLLKVKNNFFWYISDKEYWFMDYEKYAHLYDPTNNDFSDRFDIAVLDKNSVHNFIDKMTDKNVPTEFLRKIMNKHIPINDWNDSSFLFPCLFLDFDESKLYSLYSESISFENYIPKKWEGFYDDFYDKIPIDFRYWIINNKDWFASLFNNN